MYVCMITICVPYILWKFISDHDHDTPLCDISPLDDTPVCDTPDELCNRSVFPISVIKFTRCYNCDWTMYNWTTWIFVKRLSLKTDYNFKFWLYELQQSCLLFLYINTALQCLFAHCIVPPFGESLDLAAIWMKALPNSLSVVRFLFSKPLTLQ